MLQFMVLSLAFTAQIDRPVSHLRMPVHGTLYKGKVYGLFQTKAPQLFRLSAIDLKKPEADAEFMYGMLSTVGIYQRYWIRFDRVWLSDGTTRVKSMSFDELDLFDYRKQTKIDAWGAFFDKYKTIEHSAGTLGIPALTKKQYKLNGGGAFFHTPDPYRGLATVPTSANTVKTFLLLHDQNEMEIWDTEARFDAKTMKWEDVADLKNFDRIACPFAEDFFAFVRKDTYFFVTESGEVYVAPPRRPDEDARTITALWDDKTRPIVGILEDVDHDRVWLFAECKAGNPKRGHYFEMKTPTQFDNFDPDKLRPVNIEGRGKRLLEYLPLIDAERKK